MSKPANVLVFIIGDQAPGHIHYLDGAPISTPNLDRLAQRGSYFSPYTTVPVCTPRRAELLTGRNAFQNGCRWFNEPIRSECTLLPEALSSAGYLRAISGSGTTTGIPGTSPTTRPTTCSTRIGRSPTVDTIASSTPMDYRSHATALSSLERQRSHLWSEHLRRPPGSATLHSIPPTIPGYARNRG